VMSELGRVLLGWTIWSSMDKESFAK